MILAATHEGSEVLMPTTKPSEPAQIPASPPAKGVEDRIPDASRPTLPPDLKAAFEASWARHEAAYRYLGR